MGDVWLVIEKEMLLSNRYIVRQSAFVVVNLANSIGVNSFCIVIGGVGSLENHIFLKMLGFNYIIFLEHPLLQNYCPDYFFNSLVNLVNNRFPSLLFFPPHPHFYDISSHIAHVFHIPVVYNCDRIKPIGRTQLLLENVINNGSERVSVIADLDVLPSAVVTIKKDAMQYYDNSTIVDSIISAIQPELSEYTAKSSFARIQKACVEQIALEDSDVIIAGGGGVRTEEGWSLIKQLSQLLGAKVAGSRAALIRGYISDEQLVGISGKIVSPKLYIAVGISGSIEHLMGMKSSETVICINKEKTAPMFRYAHLAIVADLYEFLPKIIEALSLRNNTIS